MRCRRRRFFRECAFAKDELKREALARRVAGAHAHGKSRAVDALDTTAIRKLCDEHQGGVLYCQDEKRERLTLSRR
jgi:hypothetical protein